MRETTACTNLSCKYICFFSFILQDIDLKPEFRVFSYRMLSGANMFDIDANTGLVTTKVKLDRESQGVINITVAAVDTGSPPMTGG